MIDVTQLLTAESVLENHNSHSTPDSSRPSAFRAQGFSGSVTTLTSIDTVYRAQITPYIPDSSPTRLRTASKRCFPSTELTFWSSRNAWTFLKAVEPLVPAPRHRLQKPSPTGDSNITVNERRKPETQKKSHSRKIWASFLPLNH
ncbi:hypothetical protein VTG60DRAFT_634 [Thermothelomyces hinnuleus]